MTPLDAFGRFFESDVQARGREYYRHGSVRINHTTPRRIEAAVQGSEIYDVILSFQGSSFKMECTCPFFNEHGSCKHCWATILQAEKGGLLPRMNYGRLEDATGDEDFSDDEPDTEYIVPEVDVLDEDDDDDEDEEDGAEDEADSPMNVELPIADMVRRASELMTRGGPKHAGAAHGPKAQPWKREIEEIRRRMQQERTYVGAADPKPWPTSRRVVYLIDVARTVYAEQALVIELATQVQDKSGPDRWMPPKMARLNASQIASAPDPEDRIILQMLAGVDRYHHVDTQISTEHTIHSRDYDLLLRRICETGKCFVKMSQAAAVETRPVVWDEGSPWEFWLEAHLDETGERYHLSGSLRRGEQRMSVRDPVLVLNEGLVITRSSVAKLQHFGAFAMLAYLRHAEKPISVSTQQGDEMLRELFSLSAVPRLELPKVLEVQQVSPTMRARLRITPPPKSKFGYDDKLVGILSFDYGGITVVEGESPALFNAESRTVLQRDLTAERMAAAKLDDLKFKHEWSWAASGERSRRLSPSKLNRVVLELVNTGWQVEAEGRLYRQPGEFKMEVRSGIDWFELDASVDFGNGISARLPRLLAALRKGEKTVQLDDGTIGILPEQWLQRYGLLARMSKENGESDDTIKFTKGQVGLLDALVSTMPQAKCDEVFENAREQLRKFDGIDPIEPPEGFIGELRPYQKQGIGWLDFLNRFSFGGILADDMGLGKTVQVLSLLQSRKDNGKPSLVVVPKSLIFNWVEEAKRFTPELKVLDHTGAVRVRSSDHFKDYHIILTTYGTLRLDITFMKDYAFDYAILDEAQSIKNNTSESAKAARLVQSTHRLAMSGTPVQNHLGELWSLFEFLNPGMLGTATVFKATGAGSTQIEREGRELLARALRPFILRRTKEQVAKDLPEKTEQTIYCELDTEQRKLYDELKEHYRATLLGKIAAEGINKAKIQILEALLRLRQAACHPGLIDKDRIDQTGAKLDALLPQIAEVVEEGHKVLVFSQFTSMLAIVKRHLDKLKIPYEYLDGKTRDRQAKVDRFQNDPDCRLFLISLKAGGLGLNLTAAEYVFLLDPWWNPAVEAQAIDRAHRIGQTRHVFAYRLIAKDTVEQKVLDLQAKKKDLADMILNADSSLISQLKREDLELLLA